MQVYFGKKVHYLTGINGKETGRVSIQKVAEEPRSCIFHLYYMY